MNSIKKTNNVLYFCFMETFITIVVKESPTSQPKNTVVNALALAQFQSVLKERLIDYWPCDQAGNRIKKAITTNAKDKAIEAMKERAKSLKIKGYHLMGEEKLLEEIQKASKNKQS